MGETEILIAIVVGILSLVLFYLVFGRRKARKSNVLIIGICDSGKTLIFTQLAKNLYRMTQTSLQENAGTVTIKNSPVPIIDIPGHERLRQQMLEKYLPTCRAVIFAVDSSTVVKEIKDVAECLYMVLTDIDVMKGKVPVLIACNKQDLSFPKSSQVIQSLLEKELTTVRKTRAASLESTDGSKTRRRQLGKEGVDFTFDQLLPQKIEAVECSAKGSTPSGDSPDLTSITHWLATV
ncbi:signal recognition particle receptor subunit beta-like [Watersipora subatra]|uniref:signal recognition particle receptor subunit beta-like n=1 Tax=Watersipora subatra TaxID=2589382 RepID=UPI00355B790F